MKPYGLPTRVHELAIMPCRFDYKSFVFSVDAHLKAKVSASIKAAQQGVQATWGTRRVILAFFATLSFSRFEVESTLPPTRR